MDKVLLSKATSPDDDPIPGYVLSEIARNTIDSPQVCGDLEGYLLNKLKKPNHNVKYKTLLIIKHVCRNGHSDFKKDISRNLDSVRSCLQYKGPPDPLRGDEIYKRVRDMAKDAIDAVYDNQTNISSIAITNRIQGIGSNDIYSSNQSNNNYSSDTSPKPTGAISYLQSVGGAIGSRASWLRKDDTVLTTDAGYIGNLSATPQSSTSNSSNTFNSFLAARSQSLANPVISDNRVSSVAYGDDYNEREWNSATTTSNGSFRKPSMASSDELHFISNRGPHAVVSSADGMYNASAILPGAWQQQSNMQVGSANTGSSLTMVGRAGVAASDGSYEKSIVDGLCPPGGLKPIPPQDKLDSFLESAPTLSAELVGACLLEQLNSDHWTSRVKALLVIDALFSLKISNNHHKIWWRERLDEIEAMMTGDAKSSVRTQAARLVKHITSVSESSTGNNAGELGIIDQNHDTATRDRRNSTNESITITPLRNDSHHHPAYSSNISNSNSSNNNTLSNLLELGNYSEENHAESAKLFNNSSSSSNSRHYESQISNSSNSSNVVTSQYQNGSQFPDEETTDLFAGMSLKTPSVSLSTSSTTTTNVLINSVSNDLGATTYHHSSNGRTITTTSPSSLVSESASSVSTTSTASIPTNTLDFLSDVQTTESNVTITTTSSANTTKIANHQTVQQTHTLSTPTTMNTNTKDYLSELSSLSNIGSHTTTTMPSPSPSPPSYLLQTHHHQQPPPPYPSYMNTNLPPPPTTHHPSQLLGQSQSQGQQALYYHHHPANYSSSVPPFARYPLHQGQGPPPPSIQSTHPPLPSPYHHHIPIYQNINNGGGMVLPTSTRKLIPDPSSISTATSTVNSTQPAGSGFAFLATESSGSKEDSFSFVTDVIRASKK